MKKLLAPLTASDWDTLIWPPIINWLKGIQVFPKLGPKVLSYPSQASEPGLHQFSFFSLAQSDHDSWQRQAFAVLQQSGEKFVCFNSLPVKTSQGWEAQCFFRTEIVSGHSLDFGLYWEYQKTLNIFPPALLKLLKIYGLPYSASVITLRHLTPPMTSVESDAVNALDTAASITAAGAKLQQVADEVMTNPDSSGDAKDDSTVTKV